MTLSLPLHPSFLLPQALVESPLLYVLLVLGVGIVTALKLLKRQIISAAPHDGENRAWRVVGTQNRNF